MQTFNSFNELAAGQSGLASDLSTFNEFRPRAPRANTKVPADTMMRVYKDFADAERTWSHAILWMKEFVEDLPQTHKEVQLHDEMYRALEAMRGAWEKVEKYYGRG